MTSVRLLPAVMISAALLLTLKVAGLATGAEPLVASVEAADGEPAEQAAMPEAEGGDSAAMPEAAAETPAEAGPVDLAAQPMPRRIESLEVLDALAARRRELDARAADLDMREKLLAAAEARIDGKIEELKTLKGDIDTALQVEEERGEERLQSLVKVYENMKAKDAAAVFEKLDTDVLLALLERMNERRMGAILAAMDPLRAQEVTVALAKAHEERLSAVPAGAARTLETPAPMGLPELEPILPDVAG